MKTLSALVKRNVKLFFKDKGLLFTSLITPAILLVLYVTFLGNVYEDSIASAFSAGGISVPQRVIDGIVGGELVSSLLAVSCVTVAFCSNFLMVQDKVCGAAKDIKASPASASTISLAYYLSNLISTLVVVYIASAACLVYLAVVGFYLSALDVILLVLDVTLLSFFGSALSSVVNFFLNSQGAISAVGTIVSSGYGFICGAYMPLSSFGEGLRKALTFLPGTYGTSLVRDCAMRGALAKTAEYGASEELIRAFKDSVDCNIYFFGERVSALGSYAIVVVSILVLAIIYLAINAASAKRANK